MTPVSVEIKELGSSGDGIADINGKDFYVPFSLPGEKIRIKTISSDRGKIEQILEPSPNRITPCCRHFGKCGGCSLQHMEKSSYLEWKTDCIKKTMEQRGFDSSEIKINRIISVPEKKRRRAVFSFFSDRKSVLIGFNQKNSHNIINIKECFLIEPEIEEIVEPLRKLFEKIIPPAEKKKRKQRTQKLTGNITVIKTENGLDVLAEMPWELNLETRENIAEFSHKNGLSRFSWADINSHYAEPIAEIKKSQIRFTDTNSDFPAGAFLQPSIEGEQHISSLILKAIKDCSFVADLFCGLGSFTFPTAKHGIKVHAVDNAENSVKQLQKTANKGQLQITTETRNLNSSPLVERELSCYDGIVFDPPRAGAKEQIKHIAKMPNIQKIAAVSCNPATFARDAKTLTDNGFILEEITPVDQFLFSHHLELVAIFSR